MICGRCSWNGGLEAAGGRCGGEMARSGSPGWAARSTTSTFSRDLRRWDESEGQDPARFRKKRFRLADCANAW